MHWFSDVLRLVRGGKEASVYQCASPMFRRLRPATWRLRSTGHACSATCAGSPVREGRQTWISTAISSGITVCSMPWQAHRIWPAVAAHLWISYEIKALQTLHAAGADVPQPFASGDNAILMTYLGGDESAAPTLNTVELTSSEARPLFQRLLHNVEIMLAHGLVHGDLSAYNVLYWEGEVTLIDFPQVISPRFNSNAYHIFERDLTRLCEYFNRQGVRSDRLAWLPGCGRPTTTGAARKSTCDCWMPKMSATANTGSARSGNDEYEKIALDFNKKFLYY